jgi:hypothetical protein
MTDETTAPGVPETPAVDAAPDVPETSATSETTAETQPPQPVSATDAFSHPEVKRRLSEMTWARREAERRESEALDRLLSRAEPKEEPKQAPKLEDFGFDDARYQTAQLDYIREEARRTAQQETAEALKRARDAETRAQRTQQFKTREAEFAARADDYYDVVYDPSTPISEPMAEVIGESEHGAALAYHLAKNPELARKLYALPPIQAAREMGRIEARFAEPAPRPVVTNAPPPAPTLKATETPSRISTLDPESDRSMSDAEWVKAERARMNRKAKRNG